MLLIIFLLFKDAITDFKGRLRYFIKIILLLKIKILHFIFLVL